MRWAICILTLWVVGYGPTPAVQTAPSVDQLRRFCFVQEPEGKAELFVRSIDDSKLRRISGNVNGAASFYKGSLIYTTSTNQASQLISRNLESDHSKTMVDDREAVLDQATCHPFEEHFLYLRTPSNTSERESFIWEVSKSSPQPRRLPSAGSVSALNQQWSPDGNWLIYELANEACLVLEDSNGATRKLSFTGTFTWLPDSNALIIAELTDPSAGRFGRLVRYDVMTWKLEVVLESDVDDLYYPRVAPDGRQLAYIRRPLGTDAGELWVLDLKDVAKSRQISNDPKFDNFDPQWSPDSSQLLWSRLDPKLSRYSIWLTTFGELPSKLVADDAIWPRWIP